MQVFPHITQRNDKHVCIKFDDPPSKSLVQLLKSHGRHRPIGNGVRAWQFKSDTWRKLCRHLVQEQHSDIAFAVRGVVKQWRHSDKEESSGHPIEASESTDSDGVEC